MREHLNTLRDLKTAAVLARQASRFARTSTPSYRYSGTRCILLFTTRPYYFQTAYKTLIPLDLSRVRGIPSTRTLTGYLGNARAEIPIQPRHSTPLST